MEEKSTGGKIIVVLTCAKQVKTKMFLVGDYKTLFAILVVAAKVIVALPDAKSGYIGIVSEQQRPPGSFPQQTACNP